MVVCVLNDVTPCQNKDPTQQIYLHIVYCLSASFLLYNWNTMSAGKSPTLLKIQVRYKENGMQYHTQGYHLTQRQAC